MGISKEIFRAATPTLGEIVIVQEASRKRGEAYQVMDDILPLEKRGWHRRIVSPKALCTIAGQPGITRYWLERDVRDATGAINLIEDRVQRGRARRCNLVLALDREGTLYGDNYVGYTPSQHSYLMDDALRVLALVHTEAEKAKIQAIPVVMPEPRFALFDQMLSS